MIYQMTRKIFDVFEKINGKNPTLIEKDDSSAVQVILKSKYGEFPVSFISNSENNDVAVCCDPLIIVDEDEILPLLPQINKINTDYRYVRFYCNYQGEVRAAYDYFISDEAPEESVKELLECIMLITERAYPILRKAIDEIRGVTEEDKKRNVINEIEAELKKGGYSCNPIPKGPLVHKGVSLEVMIDGQSRKLCFFINLADKLEVRLDKIMHIDEEHHVLIGPLLENINFRKDGLEFLCDEDGEINIRFDYLRTVTDPVSSACDMVECVAAAVRNTIPMVRYVLEGDNGTEGASCDVQIKCRKKKSISVMPEDDSELKASPLMERIERDLREHGFQVIVQFESGCMSSLIMKKCFSKSDGVITVEEQPDGTVKLSVLGLLQLKTAKEHEVFRQLQYGLKRRFPGLTFGVSLEDECMITVSHTRSEFESGSGGNASRWVHELIDAGRALKDEYERRSPSTHEVPVSPMTWRVRKALEQCGHVCTVFREADVDVITLDVSIVGQDRKIRIEMSAEEWVNVSLPDAFQVEEENIRKLVRDQVKEKTIYGDEWSVRFNELGWMTLSVDLLCDVLGMADRVKECVKNVVMQAQDLYNAVLAARQAKPGGQTPEE